MTVSVTVVSDTPAPGPRTIERLLIANRGEVARRIQRTARSLGIVCVAAYGPPDVDEPYVREADIAVALPDARSFLDAGALLAAARAGGADAVHPGFGFLSEDAAFAEAVLAAGLVWVGPPPAAMRAMGRKDEAKRIARVHDLPTLDATPDGPYPLLVKAAAGGGGRGMRVVERREDLDAAMRAAAREAEAAFGDPTLLLERYVPHGRHVEVQVIGDAHGTVVHLGTRDCSVQRRHQKLIEEAPAPGLPDDLRDRLHEAAVTLATAVGYVGAGTVEFLVDARSTPPSFAFLEMNTRLQVEHPVTEAICGFDLVGVQLWVAEGKPLPFDADDVAFFGHAIEVRLCAEEPAAGHLPSVGRIGRFHVPVAGDGVRVDSGVADGSVVSPFYDSMLAKVIVHADDRESARRLLAATLDGTVVTGVRTNRAMLAAALRHSAFRHPERLSTRLLDEHPVLADAGPTPVQVEHAARALALVLAERGRVAVPQARLAPLGWRNVPDPFSVTELAHGDRVVRVPLSTDGARGLDVDGVTLSVDGSWRRYRVVSDGATHVVLGGDGTNATLTEVPRFPVHDTEAAAGGPTAPLPGTVRAVLVSAGQRVAAGETLVVMEAMKMEHRITAPHDAVVREVLVTEGTFVEAHAALVLLDQD